MCFLSTEKDIYNLSKGMALYKNGSLNGNFKYDGWYVFFFTGNFCFHLR